MKIYLARHGETDWNKNGILMGQADIPLNETGKRQAKNLAEELSNIEFGICFSSPLLRAKETAKIICQNKIKIIEDDLLKERGCGIFSGRNKNEINWDEYNNDKSVETNESLFIRAQNFANKIYKIDAENILIVGHSGLLKNLYHILKSGDFKTFDWDLYSEILENNGDFLCVCVADVSDVM